MNSLHLSIIEAEANIHRASFPSSNWHIFASSIIWAKIKRKMNFIERNHFRKCWNQS